MIKSLYDILLEAKNSIVDYTEGFNGYFCPEVANYLGIKPGWYLNGKYYKEITPFISRRSFESA